MDDVLKQIDQEMRDNYEDDWCYDDTCSYILRFRYPELNRTELHKQMNDVCHARAYPNNYAYRKNPQIRSVTTSIWRYGDDSKEFVHWLLDKEKSPWRGLFGNMTVHKDGGLIYAVTIDDLDRTDVSSGYVLNFLIASRMHSEKTEQFRMWQAARKAGFSEAESLVIATYLYQDYRDANKLYLYEYNHGHYPLDVVDDVWNGVRGKFMNSVTRLENADPIPVTGKWKDSAKPTPINMCWAEQERRPIRYFNQLADKPLAKPIYNGHFARRMQQHQLEADLRINLVQCQAGNGVKPVLDFKLLYDKRDEWRV